MKTVRFEASAASFRPLFEAFRVVSSRLRHHSQSNWPFGCSAQLGRLEPPREITPGPGDYESKPGALRGGPGRPLWQRVSLQRYGPKLADIWGVVDMRTQKEVKGRAKEGIYIVSVYGRCMYVIYIYYCFFLIRLAYVEAEKV